MQKSLIIGLVASIFLVIFALQNADPLTIKLWFWPMNGSPALFMILAVVFGAILGLGFSWSAIKKKNKQIISLNKKLKNLTEDDDDSDDFDMEM